MGAAQNEILSALYNGAYAYLNEYETIDPNHLAPNCSDLLQIFFTILRSI